MKKIFAIVVMAMFLGGITAPAFASDNTTLITVSLADKDPKKAKKTEKASSDCATETKTEKKSSDCTTEKKSSDCTTETKKDCGK